MTTNQLAKNIRHPFLRRIGNLILLLVSVRFVNAEETGDLLAQIRNLQSEYQIEISGLEKISNGNKVLTSGNLEQQVKQLLAGYNHVVTRSPKGKIQHIVIISKIQKTSHRRLVLPTSQQGGHNTVEVLVSGDGNSWLTLDMIIDTGADLVVLPASLIEPLGLMGLEFGNIRMQTANGMAVAETTKLKELRIAGEALNNVEAAFIDDRLLGGNKLLGMSVLSKFQVNIDDDAQIITLIKK